MLVNMVNISNPSLRGAQAKQSMDCRVATLLAMTGGKENTTNELMDFFGANELLNRA